MFFLDDSENPNKFLDIIDSINPSFMFKMEISDKELLLLQTRWCFHLLFPMPDLIFFSEVDL